jgi:hypothetical protein
MMHARCYPDGYSQKDVDALIRQDKQAQKMIRKLYDMLPSDDFIMTMDGYWSDIKAEYAVHAAIRRHNQLWHIYCDPFIKTGKHKRAPRFRIFRVPIWRRVMNVCLVRKGIRSSWMNCHPRTEHYRR